jgi:hypothetical protein
MSMLALRCGGCGDILDVADLTWSSVHLSTVPYLENGELLSRAIHRIDDPIVAETVLEASLPFLSTK